MGKVKVAIELLDKICSIDSSLKDAIADEATKNHVISELSKGFEKITENFPHLVDDIQRRIVNYHLTKGADGKVTDFIQLVDWYSMALENKPTEYWDTNGKYYNLRMNEVISMYLMARFNV